MVGLELPEFLGKMIQEKAAVPVESPAPVVDEAPPMEEVPPAEA